MFFRRDELRATQKKLHELLDASIRNSDLKLTDENVQSIKGVIERVVCLDPDNELVSKKNLKIEKFLKELDSAHQRALKKYFSNLLSRGCLFDPGTDSRKKKFMQQSLDSLSPLQQEYLYYVAHVNGSVDGLRNYERTLIFDDTYEKMIKSANQPEHALREALGSYGLYNLMNSSVENTEKHSRSLRP